MQSFAQKNWKKRRKEWSRKITVTEEGKRVPRVRSILSVRKKHIRQEVRYLSA